jgi:hypothetical protein
MVIYFKKLFRILFKYFHIHLENSMCGKLQRVILKCKKIKQKGSVKSAYV